jgi:hypothetical protein
MVVGSSMVRADQGWEGSSLQLIWDNDATRSSDRHYTQGGKARYLSSDEGVPRWLEAVSGAFQALGFESRATKFGLEAGQEIYTPENLDAKEVVVDDRPYAGWLYGSFMLQRRGPGPSDIPVMEQCRLDVGVTGPASLAENSQKIWHGRDPQGWDNQLKTEVAFALRYERSYLFRFRAYDNWDLDLIPGLDGSVGTLDIHVGTSVTARIGYNIPNRYEVPEKRTAKKFGAYFFGSVGGRAVLRNLFLDGNTWKDSHRVDKEALVGTLSSGFGFILKSLELNLSNNYVTHEFQRQNRSDSYGSVSLIWKF